MREAGILCCARGAGLAIMAAALSCGDAQSGSAPAASDPATCGNGVVEGAEHCDDGFTDECGLCNADCSAAGWLGTCGDGIVCPEWEACDDGDVDPCGECAADCLGPGTRSVCGDGVVCGDEVCDDGYADDCGSCDSTCSGPGAAAVCGDGQLCPELEACDDGFVDGCGTCNADCTGAGVASSCGDGVSCPETEACDDGYADACGSCNETCTGPGVASVCGDGVYCPETEDCNGATARPGAHCEADCRTLFSCAADELRVPEHTTGFIPIESPEKIGLVPLCDGRIIHNDYARRKIVLYDALGARALSEYGVTWSPRDALALDPVDSVLFVRERVVGLWKLDLLSGSEVEIALDSDALAIAMGNDGWVFATTRGQDVVAIDGRNAVVGLTAPRTEPADMLVFSHDRATLVRADSSGFIEAVYFDPGPPARLVEADSGRGGSDCTDLAVSADGFTGGFACSYDTVGYRVGHFDGTGVSSIDRRWMPSDPSDYNPRPVVAEFSPDGLRLAQSDGRRVQLSDAYEATDLGSVELDPADCELARPVQISFSRGGAMVFVSVTCGEPATTTGIYWAVVGQ